MARKLTTLAGFSKLSQLLKAAVRDLKYVSNKPAEYDVDMHDWYRGEQENILRGAAPLCTVCMAGSVLSVSLGFGKDSQLRWSNLDNETSNRLVAINDARAGRLEDAVRNFYDWYRGKEMSFRFTDEKVAMLKKKTHTPVPKWSNDPKERHQFFKAMERVIKLLQTRGL